MSLNAAWNRYWFTEGAISCAAARVSIAVAVLLARKVYLLSDYAAFQASHGAASYRPVGILKLFGAGAPSPALLDALGPIGLIATWLMLIGFFSRVSAVVSFFCHLILASYLYSYEYHWSHGLNVVFLGHLALMFGDSGAALSVDAMIRRRSRPAPRWPALLAQAAVAVMFSNAVYWKLRESNLSLSWALSDNLRNTLVLRHFLIGQEVPDLVRLIVSHEVLYKGLALLNLVSQSLPIVAVFFARRPWVRLVGGLAFLAESIGLDVLMDLPNPHWYPLALLFVDWEWALRRARGPVILGGGQRPATAFIVVFLGYYGLTALTGLDLQHRNYPFTSYPMYRLTLAKRPYDQHQSYDIEHPEFVPRVGATALPPEAFKSLQRTSASTYSLLDLAAMKAQLATALAAVRSTTEGKDADAIELRRTIFSIPAYPAPPDPVRARSGLMARLTLDGRMTAVLHRIRSPDCVELITEGVDRDALTFRYAAGKAGPEQPLPVRIDERGRYCVGDVPRGELLIIAEVAGSTTTGDRDVYFPGTLLH